MTVLLTAHQGDDVRDLTAAIATLARMGTAVVCRTELGDAVIHVSPAVCGCCCAVRLERWDEHGASVVPRGYAPEPWADDVELLDGAAAPASALLTVGRGARTASALLTGGDVPAMVEVLEW